MLKKIYASFVITALMVMTLLMAGCTAAETLAEGISEKSISGSGIFGYSDVGIDAATKTPKVKNLLVKGKYTSIPTGMEYVEYTEDIDSSIFNSSAKTYSRRLVFGSSDKKRADKMVQTAVYVINQPYADAEAPEKESAPITAPAEKATLTLNGVEYDVPENFSAAIEDDGRVFKEKIEDLLKVFGK